MTNAARLRKKIIKTKCQYCKHFIANSDSLFGHEYRYTQCTVQSWVSFASMLSIMMKCPHFEWEDRLTKYDFEETA